MTDDGTFSIRASLIRNRDEVKHWTSFAIDTAKIFVVLAGPIGLFLLISYLQSVRAPLPISDFAAVQVLVIVAGTFAFFLTFLLLMVYFPVLVCRPSKSLYQNLSQRLPVLRYNFTSLFKAEVTQLLLFQGSAFLVLPTYSLLWISRASDESSLFWLLGTSLLGAALSSLTFYLGDNRPSRVLRVHVKVSSRVFLGSAVRGIWCIAWLKIMAMLTFAFPIVRDNQSNSLARIILWLFFMVVTTLLYLGLARVKAQIERLPIVVFAGLFVALGTYPSFFGKRTLHVLGVGGGIPVQVLLKTMVPQGKDIIAQTIQGCLILNAGSRIILQPLDAPSENTCSREFPLNEGGYKNMYRGIEVLSSADVINVKRFGD